MRKLSVAFILLLFICVNACNNQSGSLTQDQEMVVKDSVLQMMGIISKTISSNGPVEWLNYFENSPHFFMASDGKLVFPNNDSAVSFIKNILVRHIQKINLQWGNIQIDPLSATLAGVAANWKEAITDFTNNTTNYSGYFTAIAENTSKGWQLRNAHWSAVK